MMIVLCVAENIVKEKMIENPEEVAEPKTTDQRSLKKMEDPVSEPKITNSDLDVMVEKPKTFEQLVREARGGHHCNGHCKHHHHCHGHCRC